jgi:iron complex transport system ATP-binding protein
MAKLTETLIRFEQCTCGYSDRVVLDRLDVEFAPAKITALLGANGSGKSTLLKAITGTLRPTAGKLSIGGKDLKDLSETSLAKLVAFVPQSEEPHFRFTVRQVVLMGRTAYANGLFESTEDKEIAECSMAMADCLELSDRPVTELSGGERQRVLIARALAQNASCLLLDEPTAHLDIAHQGMLGRVLRQLADEEKTIVVALHDLNQAATIADRLVVLHNHRMAIEGPVESVLNDSALDRVYGVEFSRFRDPNGHLRIFPIHK